MSSNYFKEQHFKNVDYVANYLTKGEYEFCHFKNCNFSGSDLFDVRFIETTFEDCNFSNAILTKTSFQDVIFKNCKMLGLQFETCHPFGFAARFEGCQLNHSIFYGMKLNQCSFQNSQLVGVDFGEAEMKNVLVQHCDLLNATFDRTNLEKADLRQSVNYLIDPENNKIKGAKFSLSEVAGLLAKYQIMVEE